VILSSDISPDLPQISADEDRVLEVFENLIGNAIKATNRGGSIVVGASSRGEEVHVSVKDTGCGISADHMPHIFDRFWQATRQPRSGSGLGLTISKAIVEAHGGRLWAESVVDHGTTFHFTLPASAERRNQEPRKTNILLVDDRRENLVALRAILENDYRLVSAMSGDEALSHALQNSFDLALIDIAMPGMNGFEVARHLKQLDRSRDILILFITAYGEDPDEIHRAYSAGGADYLIKPLDPEVVRKKVAVFAELSRRRRPLRAS
jgi:CheY-like chemotaxis protein